MKTVGVLVAVKRVGVLVAAKRVGVLVAVKRVGVLVATALCAVLMVTPALAQGPQGSQPTAAPAPAMPGGMPMMDMCADMMGGGMAMPMMHRGMMPGGMPMMGGGMMGRGMMGGGPPMDPKEHAAMMEMRGEMMKAMGDIMIKHAQRMQGKTGN